MGSCDMDRTSSNGSDFENSIDLHRSSLEELCTVSPEQMSGNLESYTHDTSCSTSQSYACSPPCMESRHSDSGVQERNEVHPTSHQTISATKPKEPAPGAPGRPWISPFPGNARSSQFPLNHPHSQRFDGLAWQSSAEQKERLQVGQGTERMNYALSPEWGSRKNSGWNFGTSQGRPSMSGWVENPSAPVLVDAGQEQMGHVSHRGPEKIGCTSDIGQSDRELTGFEKAMISLENGRDFDVTPKNLARLSDSSNARRISDEGLLGAEQKGVSSGKECHVSLRREGSPPVLPNKGRTSAEQDVRGMEGLSGGGSFSKRSKSSRRQEKPRKDDGGASSRPGALGESGQHTGPVFHPLPSLFSYPPQSLQPWLPTGVKRDMPTVALLNSCCLESRMVNDYMDSQQEMSLMLALPGMPISKAPMLTLKEAGNVLRVVNEPLAVLKSGRLTKTASPNSNVLKATDDIGVLALWLSPASEIKVIWHSLKHPAPKGQQPVDWNMEEPAELFPLADGAPFEEVFCFMEASEELACIPQNCGSESGTKGVTLDVLDQDHSGRSFKLTRQSRHGRQRRELAEKLDAEKVKKGGRVSRETAKLQTLLRACQPETDQEESLFFWIAESNISKGKKNLGNISTDHARRGFHAYIILMPMFKILEEMQTQIATMPTLSSKSGVPANKLQEVYEYFAEATQIANAAKAAGDQSLDTTHNFSSWFVSGPGLAAPSHLFAMGSSSTLFEQMAQATSSRSRSTSRSSLSSRSARSLSPSSSDCQSNVQNSVVISDSCVLSATANFLVSDKRWNINHLSTITVTVAMGVRSTGDVVDKAKCEEFAREHAHQVAKSRAECGAQAEAERLGRRRLEELTAEKIARIPKQPAMVSASTRGAGEALSRPSFQEGRTLGSASSRISLSGPETMPSTSSSAAGTGREPNHWQRNSGRLHSYPGFIPENMYISSDNPQVHSNKNTFNGVSDREPPLGLGFGSGRFAMRNGQREYYGGARPPGYSYGQWRQSRHNGVAVYPQTGTWRPHGIPDHGPSHFAASPWSQPLKHFALQGRIGVPPVRMQGMNPGQYPRHLPPMLPYLALVNQGLIQGAPPLNTPGFVPPPQAAVRPSAPETQPATFQNSEQETLSGIWKHMGGEKMAWLDKLGERSMDAMCSESEDEFRRKSMGDIQKGRSVDTSRRSADSCRRLHCESRRLWKEYSDMGEDKENFQ